MNYVKVVKHTIKSRICSFQSIEIIDVSDKVKVQEALEDQKLTQMMNATVSHEMRNPINSIQVQIKEM